MTNTKKTLVVLALHLVHANAAFRGPLLNGLFTPRLPRSPPPIAFNGPIVHADKRRGGLAQLVKPVIVPAVSYAGLAGVAVGAGRVVAAAASPGALIFGMPLPLATLAAIAAPAVFLLGEVALFGGGEHVAKMMGGKPADASLTAIANDIAARAGLPSPAYVYEIPSDELNAFAAGFGKGDTHSRGDVRPAQGAQPRGARGGVGARDR